MSVPVRSDEEWKNLPELEKCSGLDFQKTVQELEALGFSLIHSVFSVSQDSIRALGSQGNHNENHYGLWHHPAGVLLLSCAYGSRGDWFPLANNSPSFHQMSALTIFLELDVGAGLEYAARAIHRIGSGTQAPQMDGTVRQTIRTSLAGGEISLCGFLSMIQCHGRLVPVEKWTERAVCNLPEEMLCPLPSSVPTAGPDPSKSKRSREGLKALESAVPSHIRRVLSSHWRPASPDGFLDAWKTTALAHAQVSEVLFLSRKRFPSAPAREIVGHWLSLASGQKKEMPFDAWRAFEKGPAGLSLPTVLLFSDQAEGNGERLLEVLRQAPLALLQSWMQDPDGAGYTFGQRILQRTLQGSGPSSSREPLERLLGRTMALLVERVGPSGFRMTTPQRSALGLWLQGPVVASLRSWEAEALSGWQAVASQLMSHLEKVGVEWLGPVRWRARLPHSPDLRKKAPAFIDLGGSSPSIGVWTEYFRARRTPGAQEFDLLLGSKLLKRDLEKNLPSLRETPVAPRSRL